MHTCFTVYHHIKYLLALLCGNYLVISIECYTTDTLKKKKKKSKIMKEHTDESARQKILNILPVKGIM